MPSPVQAHSKAIFRDAAAGAALAPVAAAYINTVGSAREFASTRPETAAFVDDGTGVFVLTDLPLDPGANRLDAVFVGDTVHVY